MSRHARATSDLVVAATVRNDVIASRRVSVARVVESYRPTAVPSASIDVEPVMANDVISGLFFDMSSRTAAQSVATNDGGVMVG